MNVAPILQGTNCAPSFFCGMHTNMEIKIIREKNIQVNTVRMHLCRIAHIREGMTIKAKQCVDAYEITPNDSFEMKPGAFLNVLLATKLHQQY